MSRICKLPVPWKLVWVRVSACPEQSRRNPDRPTPRSFPPPSPKAPTSSDPPTPSPPRNFPVTRPSTTPCVVTLLDNAEFDNFNPATFTYTPPAACPGPWAAVIFTASINVTPGIQYDRTANFWLGPTIIYFGTTAEPSPPRLPVLAPKAISPNSLPSSPPRSRHRRHRQPRQLHLHRHHLRQRHAGVLPARSRPNRARHRQSSLLHSPPDPPVAPSPSTTPTATFRYLHFPTNITNAYLDVFPKARATTNSGTPAFPTTSPANSKAATTPASAKPKSPSTAQPAGVAPVYPWIFTGGIDPFLWFPMPGVQTLNFVPYRVDLTPFAATLSNGQPTPSPQRLQRQRLFFRDRIAPSLSRFRLNHGHRSPD
jgi:hypothetical protein